MAPPLKPPLSSLLLSLLLFFCSLTVPLSSPLSGGVVPILGSAHDGSEGGGYKYYTSALTMNMTLMLTAVFFGYLLHPSSSLSILPISYSGPISGPKRHLCRLSILFLSFFESLLSSLPPKSVSIPASEKYAVTLVLAVSGGPSFLPVLVVSP